MRKINKIIVHCSDSDHVEHDSIEVIRRWHLERGFKDIGYHYFIDKSGSICKGRDLETIGAHCEGQNHDSVGICLSGKNDFKQCQFDSLNELCHALKLRLNINEIFGHRYFNKNKTCPNFEIKEVIHE